MPRTESAPLRASADTNKVLAHTKAFPSDDALKI